MTELAENKKLLLAISEIYKNLSELTSIIVIKDFSVLDKYQKGLVELCQYADKAKFRYIKTVVSKMTKVIIEYSKKNIDQNLTVVSLQTYCQSLANYLSTQKLVLAKKEKAKLQKSIFDIAKKLVISILH
ncbi:MAG: hypothetical protein ABII90_03690 [Bacteroidota bacterium]